MPALNSGKIGAIVLAAGPSSRLGQPKQLLKIEGESLIRRAARAACEGGCDPVVVVTGAVAGQTISELTGLPIREAFNSEWSKGMGSSIRCGLSALLEAAGDIAAVMILVCDQPHLDARVIRRLISAWQTSDQAMTASEYAGTMGPPCCFAKSKFLELMKIENADGAKKVLMADEANVERVSWPAGMVDIDTPEDLDPHR